MMILKTSRGALSSGLDAEALAYITAVEIADGQSLESGVKIALNSFIKGCKSDGIWESIKASCILAGARTIAGALVPLKGAAPTNFNFVSGDYARKTGLVGNGSSKYLNANRTGNADPQNNSHISTWLTTITSGTPAGAPFYIGNGGTIQGAKGLFRRLVSGSLISHGVLPTAFTVTSQGPNPPLAGLFGYSRTASNFFTFRDSGTTYSDTALSQSPFPDNTYVFARNNGNNIVERHSNARLAFYSMGESIDLAKLDARVSTLISNLAAAIP